MQALPPAIGWSNRSPLDCRAVLMPADPTRLPNAHRSPGGVLRLQRSRYPSAAHHLDRGFAASFRRNLVGLSAATQTARRHVGVRALAGSRRTLHVRFDIGGVTIVAVPIG